MTALPGYWSNNDPMGVIKSVGEFAIKLLKDESGTDLCQLVRMNKYPSTSPVMSEIYGLKSGIQDKGNKQGIDSQSQQIRLLQVQMKNQSERLARVEDFFHQDAEDEETEEPLN